MLLAFTLGICCELAKDDSDMAQQTASGDMPGEAGCLGRPIKSVYAHSSGFTVCYEKSLGDLFCGRGGHSARGADKVCYLRKPNAFCILLLYEGTILVNTSRV